LLLAKFKVRIRSKEERKDLKNLQLDQKRNRCKGASKKGAIIRANKNKTKRQALHQANKKDALRASEESASPPHPSLAQRHKTTNLSQTFICEKSPQDALDAQNLLGTHFLLFR
jgi:hypothetical protein